MHTSVAHINLLLKLLMYTFISYYTGNYKLLLYKYKSLQTFANWRSCIAETTSTQLLPSCLISLANYKKQKIFVSYADD